MHHSARTHLLMPLLLTSPSRPSGLPLVSFLRGAVMSSIKCMMITMVIITRRLWSSWLPSFGRITHHLIMKPLIFSTPLSITAVITTGPSPPLSPLADPDLSCRRSSSSPSSVVTGNLYTHFSLLPTLHLRFFMTAPQPSENPSGAILMLWASPSPAFMFLLVSSPHLLPLHLLPFHSSTSSTSTRVLFIWLSFIYDRTG